LEIDKEYISWKKSIKEQNKITERLLIQAIGSQANAL